MSGGGNVKRTFNDEKFKIFDDQDKTKNLVFEVSAISTGTTRTITMPDADVDLSSSGGTFQPASDQLTELASLSDTKGNLIVGNGSSWTEIGVGTDTQVLTADSSESTGVKWADAGSGSGDVTASANLTDYAVICGDGGAKGVQSVAGLGAAGTVLTSNGAGNLPTFQAVAGTGDVVGPGSATDNAICRFDSTTGKLIQNSTATLSDAGAMATASLTLTTDLAVADGGTGASSLTDHGVLVGSGTAAITALAVGTNGQVLVGSTGADPVFATVASSDSLLTLTGGAGSLDITANQAVSAASTITDYAVVCGSGGSRGVQNVSGVGIANQVLTSNGAGALPTWQAASSGGLTWNEETGTSATMSVNNGYIANNASQVTLTLPTTASVGDIVAVVGKGAGGWKIAQNASETIYYNGSSTTTGTGGSIESQQQYNTIELICITANNDWVVRNQNGTLSVT